MKRHRITAFSLIAFFLTLSSSSIGHPGGLDSQGGHHNQTAGGYHCHREPCISNLKRQQHAEIEAAEEGRFFSTLYDRREWPHWDDADGDCQDTRAEVLIMHSRIAVTFADSGRCFVATGEWLDPYSGDTIYQASELDVDHLVPLKHAHGHGGSFWPPEKKRQFANDPDNLLPVSASANREKGALSPDEWLPPNESYWCRYVEKWIATKTKYDLLITNQEQEALNKISSSCP